MNITADHVRSLRESTGAGMMDCKRALTEAAGDIEAAKDLIRKWGLAGIEKRSGRSASEGMISYYLHQLDPELPAKKGVLLELNCETDFVAKMPEFKQLGKDIAMHIAAMEPRWVSKDDLPPDLMEREKKIIMESKAVEGKPAQVIEKIVEGKLKSVLSDRGGALLDQAFVKDESGRKTVGELINDHAALVKEKIEVRRFARFSVGESE
ncbi:MAG: translation elongation factor Ts [Actinomycetota bacterium]